MAQSVKEKLSKVGITNFPTQIDDPIWIEIRQSEAPPLTLQEMIVLKNDSFLPPGNPVNFIFELFISIPYSAAGETGE